MRVYQVPYLGQTVPMLLSDDDATSRGLTVEDGAAWPPTPSTAPTPSNPAIVGSDSWFTACAAQLHLLLTGPITRDAVTGAPIAAAVTWPDGRPGQFVGTPSLAAPGELEAWSVTYLTGTSTVTVRQPQLSRDARGAITARPALTVTRS